MDVFFVISGYLISSIILRQSLAGRFSLIGFYGARVRRIFPALIVVLAAVLAAGAFTMVADDYATLGRHALAGAGFVSNLLLWSESGYFDVNSAAKPLLHLWSLGIEEQFYIVWPLLMLWGIRRGWNLRLIALVIGLASFAWNVHLADHDTVADFFSPLSRTWELMLGAAVAFAAVPLARMAFPARNAASFAGGAAILVALFTIDGTARFPGWWALLPTFGAALIIVGGPSAWLNRRVLALRPMVGVGLISYPLYLWHWPILSFLFVARGEEPSPTALRVGAARGRGRTRLSDLSPDRAADERARSPQRPRLIGAMVGVAVAAAAVVATGGLPLRPFNHNPRQQLIARYQRLHRDGLSAQYRAECDFYDWQSGGKRAAIDPDCVRAGSRRTFLLWGDSHAQALSPGLRAGLPADTRLAQVATSGCPPLLGPAAMQTPGGACDAGNAFALATVRRLRPDTVILAQQHRHEAVDWAAVARVLERLGARRVVLIGPVPEWQPSLPRVVAEHAWAGNRSVIATGLDRAVMRTNALLDARYARSPDLTYISLIDRLCGRSGCVATVPGTNRDTLMAVDYGHLSPEASRYVAHKFLLPVLLAPSQGSSSASTKPVPDAPERPTSIIAPRAAAAPPPPSPPPAVPPARPR